MRITRKEKPLSVETPTLALVRKTYNTAALKVIQWRYRTSLKLCPPDRYEQQSLFNIKDFRYQQRRSRRINPFTLKTASDAAYGLPGMRAQNTTKNSIFHFGATCWVMSNAFQV